MTELKNNFGVLSGNTLKFIACITMLIDHMGLVLFPEYDIFRILGRISFPIFSFMIAEGCRYTKNKLKHFLMIFGLGILCQLAYIVTDPASGLSYMNILITFSFSIIMIYCLQLLKKQILDESKSGLKIAGSALLFAASVFGVYLFEQFIDIDYGFCGAILPLFVSLFMFEPSTKGSDLQKLDKNIIHVLCLTIGLVLLFLESQNTFKYYHLISIIPLLFYSGHKGKLNTKYFFYIFYPAHLVIIYGIYFLMNLA